MLNVGKEGGYHKLAKIMVMGMCRVRSSNGVIPVIT